MIAKADWKLCIHLLNARIHRSLFFSFLIHTSFASYSDCSRVLIDWRCRTVIVAIVVRSKRGTRCEIELVPIAWSSIQAILRRKCSVHRHMRHCTLSSCAIAWMVKIVRPSFASKWKLIVAQRRSRVAYSRCHGESKLFRSRNCITFWSVSGNTKLLLQRIYYYYYSHTTFMKGKIERVKVAIIVIVHIQHRGSNGEASDTFTTCMNR